MMNEAAPPFLRSIEAFEESLKRAQAGQVAAFAVITVDPKGVVAWKWHFGARLPTDLIGGLSCMQNVMITNAMAGIPSSPAPQPPIPEPASDVRQ